MGDWVDEAKHAPGAHAHEILRPEQWEALRRPVAALAPAALQIVAFVPALDELRRLAGQLGKISSYTTDMPASTLAAAYGDLQQRASDLMCVVRYTGEATRSIALQYFIDTGRATQVWTDASKL
jgi:hypothetical protein